MLEPVDRPLAHVGECLRVVAVDVAQRTAEVTDALHRAGGPRLSVDDLAHVAVRVDRFEVGTGDRVGVEPPPEPVDVLRRPRLHSLGGDGPGVLEHRTDPWVARCELGADVAALEPAHRDRQHDVVEVDAVAQRGDRPTERVRGLFEVDALGLQRRSVGELRPVGPARPGRQPLDIDQVLVVGSRGRLLEHVDGRDDVARRVDVEPVDPVEEAELHAPLRQDLVARAEDGVPHAGVHLVDDVAVVAGDDPDHRLERLAGGEVRLRHVATFVGEREVVQGAQQRVGVDGDRLGAVAAEPGAQLLAVDGLEASPDQVVLDDAAEHRRREVDGREEEADRRVVEVVPHPHVGEHVPQRADRADDRGELVLH